MIVTLRPKPKVESEHILQDVVANANTAEREKERVIIAEQEKKEEVESSQQVKEPDKPNITYQDRLKTERTIHLTMRLDSLPEVIFSGFWDGRLIQSAMNAIARQYRQRRVSVLKK